MNELSASLFKRETLDFLLLGGGRGGEHTRIDSARFIHPRSTFGPETLLGVAVSAWCPHKKVGGILIQVRWSQRIQLRHQGPSFKHPVGKVI